MTLRPQVTTAAARPIVAGSHILITSFSHQRLTLPLARLLLRTPLMIATAMQVDTGSIPSSSLLLSLGFVAVPRVPDKCDGSPISIDTRHPEKGERASHSAPGTVYFAPH